MIFFVWGFFTQRIVTQNQEKIKEDDSPIISDFFLVDETIF